MKLALTAARIGPLLNIPQGAQLVRRGNVCIVTNHTIQELSVPLPGNGTALVGTAPTGASVVLPPMGYSVVRV